MVHIMHQVLFYQTATGKQVILDFIRSFDAKDRKIIGENLRTVQFGFPMGLPLCRALSGGLWEVRCSLSSKRELRLIFFQSRTAKALVIVHGFIKKTQTTPIGDLTLAQKRMKEFQS